MAHAVAVDETIACPFIGSGEATERLLEVAGGQYRTVSASADRLHFARAVRPVWALVLGILLAPVIIGIPLLLIRATETWVAAIEQDHRRVQVRVTGTVLPDLMSALVAALGAGPRSVATAQVPAACEVVAAGPTGFGSPYAPPMTHSPGSPAATMASVRVPINLENSSPSELTSPAIPDPGDTTRFAGFVPSDRTVLRPEIDSNEPEERTMLRGSHALGQAHASRDTPSDSASAARALAVFDTGERVELDEGAVLFVGRDPVPIGKSQGALLVKIDDSSRSISKTHLSVSYSGGTALVADLGSTNGTSFGLTPAAETVAVAPHSPIAVPVGAVVRFGERSFLLQSLTPSHGAT